MVKRLFYVFSFIVFVAGSTNLMLERALKTSVKTIEIELSQAQVASKQLEEVKEVSTPKVERKPAIVSKVEKVKETIEAVELDQNDFIPSFEENNSQDIKESNIEFIRVAKNIESKDESISAEIQKNLKALQLEKKELAKSNIEINGSTPVKLFGFKSKTIIKESFLAQNFRPIKIELKELNTQKMIAQAIEEKRAQQKESLPTKKQPIHNDKSITTKEDRISTAMSATEKSRPLDVVSKNVVKKQTPKAQDLVFFDYSDLVDKEVQKAKAKKESPAQAMTSLSSIVGNSATGGEKSNALGHILKHMGDKFKKSEKKTVSSVKPPVPEVLNPTNMKEATAAFSKMTTQNSNSSMILTTHSQAINGKNLGKISDFEIRFSDDIDDILRSDSDGQLKIESTLNSNYSIRRGTIFASGHYPMSIDFALEKGAMSSKINLIAEDSFNRLIEREGLTGVGAHVLVELDELTEDVEFDLETRFEAKLFLDSAMRVVERTESDYSYILFVGVEPGNKIISFKTYKNEITSKIIHVVRDEIYFDFNYYQQIGNDNFELFEEHLLSKDASLLSVDEDEVVNLSYDSRIIKKTVNELEIKKSLYPIGFRKYFELKHLKESVFVGRWNQEKVNVPSESYMRFALSNFPGYSLENSCMVQINLSKQAKNLVYNGTTHRGPMLVESRILDTDGVFYRDLSDQSKRIFLLGEEQGSISVKVEYVDNSVDYLQTFCSKSNYVVEQL